MLTGAFFECWDYWDLHCLLLFPCFVLQLVFFLSEGCRVCVEYNVNIYRSQTKLTVLQCIFTNCPHPLVPALYNGHLTLAETGSSLAYQSFLIPKHTQGDSQKHKGHSLSTHKDTSAMAGIPRLLCGPPGDLPVEASQQAHFLASWSRDRWVHQRQICVLTFKQVTWQAVTTYALIPIL